MAAPAGYKHLDKLMFDFEGNADEEGLRVRVRVIANKAFTLKCSRSGDDLCCGGKAISYVKNDPSLVGARFVLDREVVFG